MATKQETEKYNSIHWWLRRKVGSAYRCENETCDGSSVVFEWALKKGKEYDRIPENYIQLCRKCHFSYDLKESQKNSFDKGRLLAQKARIGMKHTEASKKLMSEKLRGRKVWNEGKKWSKEARKKMSDSHKGKTPWNKGLKTK